MKTAIIGLPMVGKTSLFTILTGVHESARMGSLEARAGIGQVEQSPVIAKLAYVGLLTEVVPAYPLIDLEFTTAPFEQQRPDRHDPLMAAERVGGVGDDLVGAALRVRDVRGPEQADADDTDTQKYSGSIHMVLAHGSPRVCKKFCRADNLLRSISSPGHTERKTVVIMRL